ncbi:hypothetical protein BT63DRAFT_458547 [Microthyrium microscopicum]|uniref:Uncharacterized protein n=1 Tax=Microthyrium microscopicum TaxID=703497 RepID=A0A6A6U4H0_9PEZI|nr:hypothetical protein BT63DRAFT_458547 [Microthyrium microscopicum]
MLSLRNALYVVCCVGQYEFLGPDDRTKDDLEVQEVPAKLELERRRNRALLLGLLLPLCDSQMQYPTALMELIQKSSIKNSNEGGTTIKWKSKEMQQMIASLTLLLTHISHQLHLLRRREMYPLVISIAWFIVAFIVGVYQSFGQLGNYTVAHSLAVGLLVSFLPVLVLLSVADRNPNGVERCTQLIERWMYNVDAILEHYIGLENSKPSWWTEETDIRLILGEYISSLTGGESAIRAIDSKCLDQMPQEIRKRRKSWWLCWIAGETIVNVAIFAAFTVTFNTPTIGFGCCALSYTLQAALSTVSWIIIGISPRPAEWQRCISLLFNTISACFLILLMMFQTAGIYNSCFCQSSLIGSKFYGGLGHFGGYVQYASPAFYEKAYHVDRFWKSATVFGTINCVGWSMYAFHAWNKSRPLWDEYWGHELEKALPARKRSLAALLGRGSNHSKYEIDPEVLSLQEQSREHALRDEKASRHPKPQDQEVHIANEDQQQVASISDRFEPDTNSQQPVERKDSVVRFQEDQTGSLSVDLEANTGVELCIGLYEWLSG